MTLADCPRCHGIPFTIDLLPLPNHKPKPTMRVETVMGSTGTIHYRCGNCGYRERVPYTGEEEFPEQSPERQKLRRDYERVSRNKKLPGNIS